MNSKQIVMFNIIMKKELEINNNIIMINLNNKIEICMVLNNKLILFKLLSKWMKMNNKLMIKYLYLRNKKFKTKIRLMRERNILKRKLLGLMVLIYAKI